MGTRLTKAAQKPANEAGTNESSQQQLRTATKATSGSQAAGTESVSTPAHALLGIPVHNRRNSVTKLEEIDAFSESSEESLVLLQSGLGLATTPRKNTPKSELFSILQELFAKHESSPLKATVSFVDEIRKGMFQANVLVFRVVTRQGCCEANAEKGADVRCDEQVGDVRRHMDEFLLLHEKLKERFPGMLVPPIVHDGIGERLGFAMVEHSEETKNENDKAASEESEKSKVTDDDSVMSEAGKKKANKIIFALEVFLNELLRNPFLRNEKLVVDFIHEKERLTPERVMYLNTEESVGHEAWMDMLFLCTTPSKPAALIQSYREELDLFHAFYSSLKDKVKRYAGDLEDQGKNSQAVSEMFKEWTTMEQTKLSVFSSTTFDKLIMEVDKSYSTDASQQKLKISQVANVAKAEISYEIYVFKDYKMNLQLAEDAIAHFLRANKAYHDAKKQYDERAEKVKAQILKHKNDIAAKKQDQKSVAETTNTAAKTAETASTEKAGEDTKDLKMKETNASKSQTHIHGKKGLGLNCFGEDANTISDPHEDDTLTRLSQKLDTAKVNRLQAGSKYNHILRSMLVIELERLKHERIFRATTILKRLTAINFNYATESSKIWTNAHRSMSIDVTPKSDSVLLKKFELQPAEIAEAMPEKNEGKLDVTLNTVAPLTGQVTPTKTTAPKLEEIEVPTTTSAQTKVA